MEILQVQEDMMKKMKKECMDQIQTIINDEKKYKDFLKTSIQQV
jgi:hypothetical protein